MTLSSPLTGKRLFNNTVWNLVGNGTPVIVAFLAIPTIIREIGTDRFGVLTLAWMVIGYFSFLDFGVGRATTKFVAQYLSSGDVDLIAPLFWTSLLILACSGLVAGGTLLFLTPWLVNHFFNIPPNIAQETERAFFLLAGSIPLVLLITSFRGVLEGLHRFSVVNAIKIPTNLLLILTPLLVLPFSKSIFPIVAALVLSRLISFLLYGFYSIRSLPILLPVQRPTAAFAKQLFSYGGWLTLTNLIGALIAMGYIDRFLIGSLMSMSSVTYYVTPFEVITKLWIFPYSLMGVLFPAFSAYAASNAELLPKLHQMAIKLVVFILLPVVATVIVFARPFLGLWLGADFAVKSAEVLQLLSVGVLMNSLAQVPFTAIQSLGRPDLTAKRHLWELPFYMLAMWVCIRMSGIIGAALVWLVWSVVDMGILYWLIRKVMVSRYPGGKKNHDMYLAALTIGLLSAAYYVSASSVAALQISYVCFMLFGITLMMWFKILDDAEKKYIQDIVRGIMTKS